jgi:transcriptional regulator GlxA family with amidase domain
MKVGILIYPQCTSSMVFGLLDILSFADMNADKVKRKSRKQQDRLFDITLISGDGKPVKSSSGHPLIAAVSIRSKQQYDLIYVPGFIGDVEEVLNTGSKSCQWLKKQWNAGAIISAACNGNFLIAETGLLSKKKATTHWSVAREFRIRYTDVRLEPEKILIDEGDIISAAGVMACLNLAIYIVHRFGSPELAAMSSKIFLVDAGRKIQSPYEIFLPRKHGDDQVLRIQEWLEQHSREPITLEVIAEHSNIGRRTLLRRFKTATGDTPLVYIQKIRIEKAKRLLESSMDTFNEITWKVGYENAGTFQKLFKSETGLSPKEYRAKFLLN